MTARRLAVLTLLVVGAARADAQGRVVPAPAAPAKRARVVPGPRAAPKRVRVVPAPNRAPAQSPAQPSVPSPTPAAGSRGDVTVTLVTFGLGEAVWERFGHNALWIHDATTGTDVAYNWGLFDFEQPGFFRRFLTGDTKYWMGGEDAFAMVSAYHNAGRPITLQTLNLTPAQAVELKEFVERNALEENKYYRYDYFRDNCSTRLRDAVDHAVGGALRAATDTMRTSLTYRGESVRLTDGDIPVQTGIDIALGRPADVPLSAWESFFIPMRLRDGIRLVNVPGADGQSVPLVAEERLLAPSSGAPRVIEPRSVPNHTRRNLIVGFLLAAVVVLLRLLMRVQRWAAWLLALFGLTWSLLCGVLGTVLLLAWLVTKHVFWARNETLLLISPASLALVVFIPAALLAGRAVRRARIVGAVIALMGLCALALAVIPGRQPTREIIALFLPTHLALAWALFLYLPRRSKPAPAPSSAV